MEKAKIWIPIFVGLGMNTIAIVFPMLCPNTPIWILQLLLYFGIFLILIWPFVFLCKFFIKLNPGNKNLMYIPGIILIVSGITWVTVVYLNPAPLSQEEKPKEVIESKNIKTQPNASSSFQDRLLFMAAAEEGNVAAIESLLDKGVGVNAIDRDGYTALIRAAMYGQRACVQKLIEKGSKVDVKSSIGWTALIAASYKGHKAIVELLIENGADVNGKTNDRNTAFTFASSEGYDEIVEILKKSGAVIVRYQDPRILTAVLMGDVHTLKALLKKGVSANTIDRIGGETPLMYAVGKNRLECAKLLLEFGADVNIRAKDGHTVLDNIKNKPEMLKLIESIKSNNSSK